MNNLDFDDFKKIIEKIDSEMGSESARHKDTLLAQAIISSRGKEFRHNYRFLPICERHKNLKTYIMNVCPHAQFDLLSFTMFKEGFIPLNYICNFLNAQFILTLASLLYYIWFIGLTIDTTKCGDGCDMVVKCLSSALAFIISMIITAILEYYFKSASKFYFGLGASRK